MRSNLIRGKLLVPTSTSVAIRRKCQLAHECKRIEGQLADPHREKAYSSPESYQAWAGSASRALKLFRQEEALLSEWIEIQPLNTVAAVEPKQAPYVTHVEGLLKEAHSLLKRLSEEVDLDQDEVEVVNRLDKHFSMPVEKKEMRAS